MWNPHGTNIPGLTREVPCYFINLIFTDFGMKAQSKVLCTKSQGELNLYLSSLSSEATFFIFPFYLSDFGKIYEPWFMTLKIGEDCVKNWTIYALLKGFQVQTFKRKYWIGQTKCILFHMPNFTQEATNVQSPCYFFSSPDILLLP